MRLLELRGQTPGFIDIEALDKATADYTNNQIHLQYNPAATKSKKSIQTFSFNSPEDVKVVIDMIRNCVRC